MKNDPAERTESFRPRVWRKRPPRLRPLKVRPEELALRIPIYVGPTGTVLYEGHAYSMPPEAISMPATLYLYADRVRIVAGRYKAEHPRKFVPQESSWLAEHRAAWWLRCRVS